MGIGVNGRFGGIDKLPNMNKAVTEGPSTQGGQTVKEPAAFPKANNNPDVQKTHHNSMRELVANEGNLGDTVYDQATGKTYIVDIVEIKEDGTAKYHLKPQN